MAAEPNDHPVIPPEVKLRNHPVDDNELIPVIMGIVRRVIWLIAWLTGGK